MIRARVVWNGPAAETATLAEAWKRLRAAVITYHSLVLLALNVANPRPYRTPSRPGEPPRKRTGWLQAHVLYELDDGTHAGRVGLAKNAPYGVFLEFGTRVMRARPWLLATLKKNWDRIAAVAAGR